MAIEIEHFYINDGEENQICGFGFASGSVIDDELTKAGVADDFISKIPWVKNI